MYLPTFWLKFRVNDVGESSIHSWVRVINVIQFLSAAHSFKRPKIPTGKYCAPGFGYLDLRVLGSVFCAKKIHQNKIQRHDPPPKKKKRIPMYDIHVSSQSSELPCLVTGLINPTIRSL